MYIYIYRERERDGWMDGWMDGKRKVQAEWALKIDDLPLNSNYS